MKLWNLCTGEYLHILRGHIDNVSCVVIYHGDSMVMCGSLDNSNKVWKMQAGQCLRTVEVYDGWANSLAFDLLAEKDKRKKEFQIQIKQCISRESK